MARTFSRAAGWLVTGPFAFLVAGLIDLAAFGLKSLGERQRRSRSAGGAHVG